MVAGAAKVRCVTSWPHLFFLPPLTPSLTPHRTLSLFPFQRYEAYSPASLSPYHSTTPPSYPAMKSALISRVLSTLHGHTSNLQ
jgi:hypothetical protein